MVLFNNERDRRNIFVDILAVLFGISSWISINGLWVELPLLVERLPEAWTLASYLSVIVQLANIGPITIGLVRLGCHGQIPMVWIIMFLLGVGAISSTLMIPFWHKTATFNGSEHSIALFVLVFFLSLVDCTSSVLFLPFMGVFKEIYLNSYLVGEGMSGFVPSIAALIQGVGGNPYCDNVTKIENGTLDYESQLIIPEPRFSIEGFFIFLTCMMVVSLVAFIFLNCWPSFRHEYADTQLIVQNEETMNSSDQSTLNPDWPKIHQREFLFLLGIQCFVCFLSNGAFPSIQTYSCLPYGNAVYHLSVTLHAMANPVMAFMAFFIPCTRPRWIFINTLIGLIFAGYLLGTALYSPDMLLGQKVGGSLTVISWVIYGGLFAYVKISIAGVCRQTSNAALFWCGAVTQIGSAFGALLMFILVNYVPGIFESYFVVCD